ncbi:4-hydroxy-tetrahydrodipicolinate synthase family protein [Solimonas flava]|uniref:4-hydroxy-tetrahydrodipicolinate synthase family protein n=1 Tax=Solimonas flava TaxID=415849 RepID=UPI00042A8C47|nr:4-hydroxy-tetrahydrodipicolinate synthase [Solimonas flava]
METFSGIWVPLVTPFGADGGVDHAALAALTRRLAPHVAGFVACGSTGEAHALDDDEQFAVLDTVLAASERPVVMGTGGPNRRALHAQLAALRSRPLAGLLVPPPYYVRPSQAAIVDYYRDLADHAHCPLIVYNIPYRTGVAIEPDSFMALARHPRIQAVKDCGGSAALTLELIVNTPLAVLAGEDGNILATLCAGGSGAIAASAHLFPERYSAVCDAVREERLGDARRIFHGLWPLIQALFAEPNPAGIKAALACTGTIDRRCRAPMHAASDALMARLAALLAAPAA